MFWNKKEEPISLGVPMGDLELMLQPTSIKASLRGNSHMARDEHYTMRTEVVPPETQASENGPSRAVVRTHFDVEHQATRLLCHLRQAWQVKTFSAEVVTTIAAVMQQVTAGGQA